MKKTTKVGIWNTEELKEVNGTISFGETLDDHTDVIICQNEKVEYSYYLTKPNNMEQLRFKSGGKMSNAFIHKTGETWYRVDGAKLVEADNQRDLYRFALVWHNAMTRHLGCHTPTIGERLETLIEKCNKECDTHYSKKDMETLDATMLELSEDVGGKRIVTGFYGKKKELEPFTATLVQWILELVQKANKISQDFFDSFGKNRISDKERNTLLKNLDFLKAMLRTHDMDAYSYFID